MQKSSKWKFLSCAYVALILFSPKSSPILLGNLSTANAGKVWAQGRTWTPFQERRASVALPLHHWAYGILERLNTKGLLERPPSESKPIGRYEAALLVYGLSKSKPALSLEVERWVLDLEHEFRLELEDIAKAERGKRKKLFIPYIKGELTLFGATRAAVKNVDNIEPYHFSKGGSIGAKIDVGASITPYAAFFASPYLFGKDERTVAKLDEVYLKVRFLRTDFLFGKSRQWWGPGYHGNFVLTDNAPPLRSIQIEHSLGPVSGSTSIIDGLQSRTGDEVSLITARLQWTYLTTIPHIRPEKRLSKSPEHVRLQ